MFTANIIFILSMRIIIEICNKFSEILFFYLHIYHFAGFNAGILLVVFRFQKVFHQMDPVSPRIEIPHDLDAHEIPVPCP